MNLSPLGFSPSFYLFFSLYLLLYEQLRQTEKEWHTTHIQLKTSQAIIDEQVATESALLEQGAELQRDLLDRENDVEKLLKRVKMMASKEEERVSDATTFSAELQGSAVNLANIATSFEKKSNEHIACVMHEVYTRYTLSPPIHTINTLPPYTHYTR